MNGPKPAWGVGIGAGIELGLAHREALVDQDQSQHPDGGDAPADQDGERSGGIGHLLRQAEDAGADHGADDQGGEGAEAQFAWRGGSGRGQGRVHGG